MLGIRAAVQGRLRAVEGDTLRLRDVLVLRRAAARDPECDLLGSAALVVRGSGERLDVNRFSAKRTTILGLVVAGPIGFVAYGASQTETGLGDPGVMTC